jgi:hypothetical protein
MEKGSQGDNRIRGDMKERPIPFTAEMVRAILEGRKTQTRRVIRPQPRLQLFDRGSCWSEGGVSADTQTIWNCPYGQPGDRLWVKETFVLERYEDEPKSPSDRPLHHHKPEDRDFDWAEEYWLLPYYKATDPAPELVYDDCDEPKCRWISSRFMPKWASRIWLEIVNIRVERVQEIGLHDLLAEGVEDIYLSYRGASSWEHKELATKQFRAKYEILWNSLNAKRGYGWDVNPWVWVIEFKIVDLTPDPFPKGKGSLEEQ